MKATEGLSKDARLLLQLAAAKLDKDEVRLMMALRPAPAPAEIEELFLKVRAELIEARKTEGMREARRLRHLRELLWKNFGEGSDV